MIKMNKAPLLNTIQVAAEVNVVLRALPGENITVVVTKTVDPDRPDFPLYDVYSCKGGIVNGKLIEA